MNRGTCFQWLEAMNFNWNDQLGLFHGFVCNSETDEERMELLSIIKTSIVNPKVVIFAHPSVRAIINRKREEI